MFRGFRANGRRGTGGRTALAIKLPSMRGVSGGSHPTYEPPPQPPPHLDSLEGVHDFHETPWSSNPISLPTIFSALRLFFSLTLERLTYGVSFSTSLWILFFQPYVLGMFSTRNNWEALIWSIYCQYLQAFGSHSLCHRVFSWYNADGSRGRKSAEYGFIQNGEWRS